MTNPKKHKQQWTPEELRKMKQLAKSGTSTPEIARRLQRTVSAVRSKADEADVSLKPKDK